MVELCIKMRKPIDISGKIIGYLTVIRPVSKDDTKYHCLCKCGNEKIVSKNKLTSKIRPTKSCGCLNKEILGNKAMLSHGDNFEFWTVVRFSHKNTNGKFYFIFKCICGNEKVLEKSLVVSGITKSCGCKSNNLREETCIRKYGVKFTTQSNIMKKKKIKTCIEKYGVVCITQSSIMKEKSKNTLLKKYGVEYAIQNKEVSLKQAKSLNNSYILYHWKTNEEIVCIGTWEKKVVDFLNINKIEFLWQANNFTTPLITKTGKNRTYRPDLYLIKEDKWIEIKGYFRNNAEEKWNWFNKEYPNSELWNKYKLKEMGIL